VWVKLNQSHEGDEKVKQMKLHTFRMRFERFIMDVNETIEDYILRVEEFTNMIR